MSKQIKQLLSVVITLVSYSFFLSWKASLVICAAIALHELSHIAAAKKLGYKTDGFYLIPFFGGIALISEDILTKKDQFIVSIMGPIGGAFFALLAYVLFVITKSEFIGAAALWMYWINLFNMLPLSILDGGQIMNTITYSINYIVGFVFKVLSTILAIALLFKINIIISIFIGVLQLPLLYFEYENIIAYRSNKLLDYEYLDQVIHSKKLDKKSIITVMLCWAATVSALLFPIYMLTSYFHIDMNVFFAR